ncbi:MAG: 50S ribosomal protein L4, partial [Gammaproteobacteria bacterium]
VAFGPRPRSYDIKVNKRIRREALRCALSRRQQEGHLVVLEDFELAAIKTRSVVDVLSTFEAAKALIVDGPNDNLAKSANNLEASHFLMVEQLNVYDVLKHDTLMLTRRAIEAIEGARPHRDEAWFMLGLLALTALHGITMMPFWETWMLRLARVIGDSAQLLGSFTIGMMVCLAAVGSLYAAMVALTCKLSGAGIAYWRCFSTLAFVALPLAFAYHLAHNLNHLIRESVGVSTVFTNPLGIGTLPLSMEEKHQRHLEMLLSPAVLHALQAALMIAGFIIAVQTIRARGAVLLQGSKRNPGVILIPMLLFALIMTGFHAWMLMQPMIMRM